MLKYFVKNENIKSIESCVKKLIKTSVPSNVYDMPYILWNVISKIGGSAKTGPLAK